jgi:phosphoribosyl 1,2-cyclic phosphodiesterase
MSLELCVLASGSAGNASLIRSPSGLVVVDAGIDPRTFVKRLQGTGVSISDITAFCITHLDGDHFSSSWQSPLRHHNIPIYCHIDKVALLTLKYPLLAHLIKPFDEERFSPMQGVHCQPVFLPHDSLGSHGFVFDRFGFRIGYATDLGHIPGNFFKHFQKLDIIALESNYDADMLNESARPDFVKRRIAGPNGHLSNEQAFAAIQKLVKTAKRLPDHIVLLHRSLQCNCPKILNQIFRTDKSLHARLTIAQQHQRSAWLGRQERPANSAVQLQFAF